MSLSRMFYDFWCNPDQPGRETCVRGCGIRFEARVYSFEKETPCPNCGQVAYRELASPSIWWRKMGVSKDFPTAAAKWDRMQEQKNRVDKGGRADGQPNLKEF